jgi:hypothetical protein
MWLDILGIIFITAGLLHIFFRKKTIKYQLQSYVKSQDKSHGKKVIKILNIRIIAGSIFLILLGFYFLLFH